MRINKSAFTVVELLIIIVCIGILATIVIVSYKGVSDQARDAKRAVEIDQYTGIIQLYGAYSDGNPPDIVIDDVDPNVMGTGAYCIGEKIDYPANERFKEGECAVLPDGTPYAEVSQKLNNELKKATTPLPNGSYPTAEIKKIDGSEILLYVRGAWVYPYVEGNQAAIYYYDTPSKSKNCPHGQLQSLREESGVDANICFVDVSWK